MNPSEPDSDSESESSHSDEASDKSLNDHQINHDHDENYEEDEDSVGAPTTGAAACFTTINEITDVDINIPHIEEVGPEEPLEKVGEVMIIVGSVAIVCGLPSEHLNHASERALDSDTLLVFEDRKVMGYVRVYFSSSESSFFLIQYQGRSMKPSDRQCSLFTKSSSVIPSLWILCE